MDPHLREFFTTMHPQTMLGSFDIDVVEASGTRVVLTMPVGPRVHQPYGYLHGGASVVLAETAASIGAWLAAGPDHVSMGIEINANHLKAVRSGVVQAVATPVRTGRSIAVWDVRISDGEGDLVCVSRCTLAVRPARS